jgi:hypothetical protein
VAVEDIELRLTVDGRPAQRALEETRLAAEKMGGGAAKVIGSLEGLQKGAQALQQKLAPTAAAISSVAGALGQAGGEAGKVVAGLGQLAAAFGAGGPLGLGIVATTLAFDKYLAVQKEATEAENVWRGMLQRTTPEQERARQSVASLADEAKRFSEEVRNAGKTEYEVALARAATQKTQLETMIANIEKSERLRQASVNRAESALASARGKGDVAAMGAAQEQLDTALAVQQKVREDAAVYRSQVASIEDSVWQIADAWMAVEQQSKKASARGGGGGGGVATGDVQGMLAKEYADRLKLLKDFGADVEKEREAIEEDLRSISLTGGMRTGGLSGAPARGVAARPDDELNELRKAAERSALAAQDWSLAWKLASNEVTEALAVTGNELANLATSAAASLGTFIAESAAGQEAALANLLKAASQQAGGFVMLEGGKLIAAGVTSLGLGNPIGAGQIAGGAGLVAAGAAIQAGGPLAVSSLLGQSGGAGAAAASGTATDPGARARPARTMPGEGGGTQLTIVYGGLSGPTADDGARALKKGEQRARKRGY